MTRRITRRHVLAAMGAVPVVGALGAGATAWQWWDRPPGDGLLSLSSDEHAFVQALAEAWLPPGGEPAISGAEARLGDFFDDVVAAMSDEQAVELKLLLQLLDDLPRATHWGRPFRALELEARIAQLDGWVHHDQWLLRNAAVAVLALIGGGYTTHPDVLPMLSPWFKCAYGR